MVTVNFQIGKKNCYNAFDDVIILKPKAKLYVKYHELAHWARHKSRCGLLGIKREEVKPMTGLSISDFGDKEEAIAELVTLLLLKPKGKRKKKLIKSVCECLEDIPHELNDVVRESRKTVLWLLNNELEFK